MKFEVRRVSSLDNEPSIDINTLEDLLAFVLSCAPDQPGCPVIICPPRQTGEDWELEIYDDYRE
jgi:hypothetical protein